MQDPSDDINARLRSIESRLIALESEGAKGDSNRILIVPKFQLEIRPDKIDKFSKLLGVKPEALPASLEGRFASWEYSWNCNVFKVCFTSYFGRFFVIRTDTG